MNRPWVVTAAILLGLGFLWLHQHDVDTRRLAQAETSRDSLTRALSASQAAQKAREAQIDTLQHQNDSLGRLKRTTLLRVDRLKSESGTADSAFAGRLSDSLRVGFDSLRARHAKIVAALEKVIRGDSLASANNAGQLALRGTSLSECQSGLSAALQQRETYRKISQPGFLTRVIREIPVVLVTAGAVLVLRP